MGLIDTEQLGFNRPINPTQLGGMMSSTEVDVLKEIVKKGEILIEELVKMFRGKNLPRARIMSIIAKHEKTGRIEHIRSRGVVVATDKAMNDQRLIPEPA